MLARRLLVLLLLAAATSGCGSDEPGPSGPAQQLVVETGSGAVRGVAHDGVESWRGIPYAAPPLGDLRWRPPREAEPWTGVRDAGDYGPVCPQAAAETLSGPPRAGSSSEDCLTLNVNRPAGGDTDLPVMVWVHGGGFSFGAGSETMYNSPELVRRGVVLVTLNYRLGALGFLAHPALEEEGARIGNFGLLDQVAGLQWVEDNIDAFGGDPSNVTVFGESAGGISVNALMSAPAAEGLFDKAISQSGFGREGSLAWEDAVALGQQALAPVAGADATSDELRALDADELMAAMSGILGSLAPIADEVLPRSVSATFAAGDEADVPYVVGATDSEIPNAPAEQLGGESGRAWTLLRTELGDLATAAYGGVGARDLYLGSDVLFAEPARHLARAHADDAPTYRYRFTIAQDTVLAAGGGAPHTAELPFVFDDTGRQGTPVPGADSLADTVADLWVDFATDGEPEGWPAEDTGRVLSFTLEGPVPEADPWEARLDVVRQGYEMAAGRSRNFLG